VKTWTQRFRVLSLLACALTMAISLMALAGIALERPELRQWFGEGPPMRVNTAVSLFFAAFCLMLGIMKHYRPNWGILNPLSTILACIPFFIGWATVLEYGLAIGTGLDQLFYQDTGPAAFPGRPAFETAFNFILLGTALLLMNRPSNATRRLVRFLALGVLFLPLFILVSSFFGATQTYSIFRSGEIAQGIAINTAVSFLFLSFAIYFKEPQEGTARLFIQDTIGGMIARRHLTALVLMPFGIVLLSRLDFIFAGGDPSMALVFSSLCMFTALVAFNWFTATQLDRIDRQRQVNEERIKASERLLSGVLDAVPVGIWITDEKGTITRGNPAGIEVWRGERYVGIEHYGEYKGWWAHSGELIGAHDWALARALEKGETSVDETIQIQCFDGSRKYMLNSAMPLRDEQQNIVGAIVTNYDISRRYRLEKHQALVAHAGEELISSRDLESTFQNVAKLMTEGLCDYSMIHILDHDHGALKLVARHSIDLPQAKRFNSLVDRYAPNPRSDIGLFGILEKRRSILISEISEDMRKSLAQDEKHEAALKEILFGYILVPMVIENKSVGILSFLACDPSRRYDDIDLSAAEELGRLSALAIENASYAEKLRQAVQIREDVVAIVSHDLRNPLAVIQQSCELITRQLIRLQAPEQTMKLAHLAKAACNRMHELISDLLDLSHLESGQFVLHCESVDSVPFVRETVELLQPLATQKGLMLQLHAPFDLPPMYVDRTRVTQILNNLIGNAIKHTAAGGSIDVHTRLRDDGWIEFLISDTGCGIKSEYLPLLFERYWKPSESKGGFGLGLYVVHGIIAAHGGSIHVTSEENKGTSFTFTIPSVLVAAAPKAGTLPDAALHAH
jgi:PAS domain S-box-containing protein